MDFKTISNNGIDVQTKVNVRRKESNYTKEEDIFLCRAWKTTPEDQEEETDQFSGTFWGRLKEKYAILIGSRYVSRAGKSLPQRWSRIKTSVSKFCAVYKSTREQNPNSNEQDMIKMALLAYKNEKKENFSFLHCWTELRNSSKWKDERISKYGLSRIAKLDEQFNVDDKNDCPMSTDMPLERSKRQKLAKQCANKGTDADVFSPQILPLSAVSAFNCSSGVINFDPSNHTATNIRQEASEPGTAKTKESHYSRQEDMFLCMAWTATSWRSAKDHDQVFVTDWQRVEEEYGRLISNNYAYRLSKSLQCRWHKIKSDVLKFCLMYENIIDQNSSCYTEKDKINMSRLTFKIKIKRKFRFYHCWNLLRDSPKWNEMLADYRPRMEAMYSQEPITSQNYSLDNHYDLPVTMENFLEELKGEGLDDHEVESEEEEEEGLHSPPALFTPILISRAINFDPNNHTATNIRQEASEPGTAKTKESNYLQEEDMFLCMAWTATSWRSTKDHDQVLVTDWQRVEEEYGRLISNDYASRPAKSLIRRWHKIKSDVLKFCFIYENIIDQNSSCYTEKDKINMGRLTFKKNFKRKFRFYHCWTVLRDSPKWNEMLADYRPKMEAMSSQEPKISWNYNLYNHYDSSVDMETSLEQVEGEGLEDHEVESEEEEEEGLQSPPATSSPLSALSTPVIISRDMEINTQDHAGDDVQIEASELVSTRKKESNFSQEEDIFLCRAWMKTKNPGRELSSTTVWGKIGEVYASLVGNNYAPRLGKSLPQRWSRIRVSVENFCTIYKKINDQNPNTCTDADKINMAVLAYQKERKEKFRFLHCWTELRHSSKWKFEHVNGVRCSRGRHFAMLAQQSSSGDPFNNNDDNGNDDSPVPIPTPLVGPKEQEPGVRKRKGQDVDNSSSDVEELLPQTHDLVRETIMNQSPMDKVIHKRKGQEGDAGSSEVEKPASLKHDIAREMLEIEREKRETTIMLIDPTTLPDGRRQYFEKLQQKILERVCGTPFPRN